MNRDRLRAGLRRNSLPLAVLTMAALGVGLIATTQAQAAPVGAASTTSPLSSTTPTLPNTSPFPPSAPTGLTAVAHASSVTLSWHASTAGCCPITGYTVGYMEAFNDYGLVVDVGNVTTTTITGLRSATQYLFDVEAKDTVGHTASASITVVTPASDTASDQTPPSTPTNLTASNLTALTVNLAWSPSTDNVGVYGYNIYRFDGLFISTLVGTTAATSYTAPLISGTNRFYVRSRDAAGNFSIASNQATVVGSSSAPSGGPSSGPSTGPSGGTGSPTASPPASRSASPSPARQSCTVTYRTDSQWAGGFTASIQIGNTGTTVINGWTLVFTFGGDQWLTNWWNTIAVQAGAKVTLSNQSWNAVIQPGGTVTLGFLGSWNTSNAVPSSFTLNGAPCTAR